MTRVVKVLTAAAKNKWKQRSRRRKLRQRTGYDGPVNLPIGNYRSATSYACSTSQPGSAHEPSMAIACEHIFFRGIADTKQVLVEAFSTCTASHLRHVQGHLSWETCNALCALMCSPGIAAAMARVHSYEWVQDALLDGQEDDDGEHLDQMRDLLSSKAYLWCYEQAS